jgi:hypothetical protein
MYLNVFSVDETCSFRYSLCPTCAEDIADPWLGHAAHQTPRGDWEHPDDGETLVGRLEALSGPRNGSARRR